MADAPSPVGAEPEPDLEPEAAEVTLAHLVVQVKRANPQARLKKLVQLIKEAAAPYGLPVNTKAARELLAQAQAQAQVDMLILEDIGEAALVEAEDRRLAELDKQIKRLEAKRNVQRHFPRRRGRNGPALDGARAARRAA